MKVNKKEVIALWALFTWNIIWFNELVIVLLFVIDAFLLEWIGLWDLHDWRGLEMWIYFLNNQSKDFKF